MHTNSGVIRREFNMKVCVSTSVKRMKDEPRSNPNYHIFLKYLFIIYFFVGKIDISFFLYAHKKKKKKSIPLFIFFFIKKTKTDFLRANGPQQCTKFHLQWWLTTGLNTVNDWVKHTT